MTTIMTVNILKESQDKRPEALSSVVEQYKSYYRIEIYI